MEPLELLILKYKFEIDKIESISSGLKYTAVLLKNGNIGVCANLGHKISAKKDDYLSQDLKKFSHRIVINAYFNALLNYSFNSKSDVDIFQVINFKKYNQIVMLGFIEPIAEKFNELKIPINIFDFQKEDKNLIPISEQKKLLKEADAVILTSTSIFNNSFLDSINATKDKCDIFMIGPSSIMTPELLEYKNIEMIFGSTFEKSDDRVLKLIRENEGTRKFLKFGNKGILNKK
ncbi:MAG: DUF364 domain-containing protein [Bacteroidota bacterium]|nr:DUF364 domain-containing protein [Bacteroidota bacterium]